MDIRKHATTCWRLIKKLFQACVWLMAFLGTLVSLDSGWPGFSQHVERTGIVGIISRFVHALVILISENAIGLLTLIVCIAILAHLLIEKARDKSKGEFENRAKKKPEKKKAAKK